MNWPVNLNVDTMRLHIEAPGRYALAPVAGIPGTDALLHAARMQLGVQAVGWVPAEDGLLANLTLWENILLATQWHAPASPAALAARLRNWLEQLSQTEAQASIWLSRSPGEVSVPEQRLAAWLRILLLRPRVVLMETDAWSTVSADSRLAALIDNELAGCALLAVDTPAPPGFVMLSVDNKAAES